MKLLSLRVTRQHRGFSMVELMVAMTLGIILTGGVVQIYINSKQTYRMQDNESRLQENGRFALQYLSKDLRMAGFIGCNNVNTGATKPHIIANPPTPLFDSATVIQGYDYVSGTLPANFLGTPTNLVPNTSVIVVRFAQPSGVFVVNPPPNAALGQTTANINISANPNNWQANDVLIVTDCQYTDVFRASNFSNGASGQITVAHANNVNTTNFLSKTYGTDAQILSYGAYMYYIGSMSGGTSTTCPCALYRQAFTGPPQQLVDNVQNMQIAYGVDTSNNQNVDRYMNATAVTAGSYWPAVLSANVTLVVNTADDNLVATPQSYKFNGAAVTAGDRRLYTTFSDIITFRNRAP